MRMVGLHCEEEDEEKRTLALLIESDRSSQQQMLVSGPGVLGLTRLQAWKVSRCSSEESHGLIIQKAAMFLCLQFCEVRDPQDTRSPVHLPALM